MSARRESPRWKPRSELTLLDHALPRVDGPEKVTGKAVFTHDVRRPGMVYARLVLHPYPRAVLTSLDLEAARAVPGVVHVAAHKAEGDALQYLGDDSVYAYVAAETPEAARDGARAVRAEFENQWPPLVTRAQVLSTDGAQVAGEDPVSSLRERGDEGATDRALGLAAHTVDAVYELPIQHHVCLETHGCVVDLEGDRATVYASTQQVSGGVRQFASMLELPAERVRIVTQHMGGGFGSKFGAGVEGLVACRLARELGRPVHLMLDRPQEFRMAGNRSGTHVRMRGGCDAEGRMVGLVAEVDRLGGVGSGSFPTPPYIYAVDETRAVTRSVHTALDSNRAMRAPGHPQASFCMESLVDELATAAGIDPLEFRKTNLRGDDDSSVWHRQLDRVAEAIGWNEHPNRTAPGAADEDGWAEGIGFAVSTWGTQKRPGAVCEVRVQPDGSVTALHAVQDLGTGSRTLVAAIVAEELGLPLARVTARIGDSDLPPSVGSGGSVTTGSIAPAILTAAHNAREGLEQRLEAALGAPVGGYVWKGGRVHARDDESASLSFEEACALLGGEALTARGEFDASLVADGRLHGAHAARVRVDTLTGRVQVVKVVAMHDQGLPLNRLALTSQINGGVIQALSYGLLERRVVDASDGTLLTDDLEAYKIAGCMEIPEIEVLIDDEDDRPPVGQAEAPVIPGHGAIANAIHNACGARLRALPFTPDRVLAALAEVPR